MADFPFKGMGVALVTPFTADLSIDYKALDRLVEAHLASAYTDYLVVLGTTGETPTLSEKERDEVARFVKDRVQGRKPLVLGLGGNCTHNVCRELRERDLRGYDAVLSVVPFYNKPTQRGIREHYMAIAEASPLPIIMYNVPGRTGVNMDALTTLDLARCVPSIIAVKEASGNMDQVGQICAEKPEGFEVISGDDARTLEIMDAGGVGVISVLGNALPDELGRVVHWHLEGEYDKAVHGMDRLLLLTDLLFREGNPAGVKCAMALQGKIENELRLPLTPVGEDLASMITEELHKLA